MTFDIYPITYLGKRFVCLRNIKYLVGAKSSAQCERFFQNFPKLFKIMFMFLTDVRSQVKKNFESPESSVRLDTEKSNLTTLLEFFCKKFQKTLSKSESNLKKKFSKNYFSLKKILWTCGIQL